MLVSLHAHVISQISGCPGHQGMTPGRHGLCCGDGNDFFRIYFNVFILSNKFCIIFHQLLFYFLFSSNFPNNCPTVHCPAYGTTVTLTIRVHSAKHCWKTGIKICLRLSAKLRKTGGILIPASGKTPIGHWIAVYRSTITFSV